MTSNEVHDFFTGLGMGEQWDVIGDEADRPAWLKLRREGLGGSDTPSIFGLTSWGSPTSVQVDKWGLGPEDEEDTPDFMRWGNLLEGPMLEQLAEERGIPCDKFGKLLRSRTTPFMQCTPDGVTADGIFVQCKNTMLAEDWKEGVPEKVMVQVQHEMYVTGHDRCIVCVLIFGNRFLWKVVERDAAFIGDKMLPLLREFWAMTQAMEPWSVEGDGSDATKAALLSLHPDDNGLSIALPGRFVDLDEERTELNSRAKADNHRLSEIANEFRAAIGANTQGVLPNGVAYTNKTQNRAAHQVKASSFRVLRRSAAKG